MAVKAKRISEDIVALAPPDVAAEEAARRTAAKVEAVLVAKQQRAALRAEVRVLMERIGKGAALWREREWQWEDVGDCEPPESLPPLPKLFYLMARMQWALSSLQWLQSGPESPHWCPECRDGQRPEFAEHWFVQPCLDHAGSTLLTMAGNYWISMEEER